MGCNGRFKVQLKRLAQVGESLLFRDALAGDIHVQALGHKPFSLTPHCGRKRTLHTTILAYVSTSFLLLGTVRVAAYPATLMSSESRDVPLCPATDRKIELKVPMRSGS
jgi:hypothetical protein